MDFINFKAYDYGWSTTEDYDNAAYLVIFNKQGYKDAVKWAEDMGRPQEVQLLKSEKGHYYEFGQNEYAPMCTKDVPEYLKAQYVRYSKQTEEKATESIQKFKVSIKLVNGVTIEPNLYSNNLYEIASIIQTLSGEKLFAGQIKNINIELS